MQQNEDMRRISAWVAIAAVPTAVAGIYGMNFVHMPELRWQYGYPGVLVLIALACLALYPRLQAQRLALTAAAGPVGPGCHLFARRDLRHFGISGPSRRSP